MNAKKILFIVVTLLVSYSVTAQQKPVTTPPVEKKSIKLFFEKAYLQTDRTYYSTGEDLWFSAYLVNGKSTNLTGTSNNLYVELISPNAQIIDRKTIRIDNGLGKGDFKLKDSIPSGWYSIRAYTNWMRNFGDAFVFQKRIYLTNNIVENSSYVTRNTPKKTTDVVKAVTKNTLNFFPEGGSLVEGINSIVAFKAEDENGNGLRLNAKIVSAKGDTVATFQSTEVGMGLFAFMPIAGEKYNVVGTFADKQVIKANFPNVLAKGLSMHVVNDSLNIRLAISANELMFKELQNKAISVVVKHGGDTFYSGSINVTKPNFNVSIPIKDIPAGIAVVTLLDDQGRPNCERLVYIQGAGVNFSVSTNKATYTPREKVILNIKATDAQGQPMKTSLSLAAVDAIIPTDATNIVSYLMLQSEIKGEVKDADKYFDKNNPSRLKQLDLLLLTQGWRDYIWRKLADSALKISYMPEPGFTLMGLVREKIANKPIPNMNITLFGSNFNRNKIYLTKTDEKGRYFLDGLNWNGNQEIKLSARDNKGKPAGWLLLDSIFKGPIPVNIKPRTDVNDMPTALLNLEIGKRMAYNRTYKFGDSILLNDITIKANRNGNVPLFDETMKTFGYPDQVFNITSADYSYKGLEHFLLTKVQGAYPVPISPSDDSTNVPLEGITFISDGKNVRPRFVVNRAEELNGERIDYYSLTMDQINQITVQHLINSNNNDVYVIRLDLKDSALRGSHLDLLNLNVTGYYTARSFYSPNYGNPANANKDLRTTIFWAPSVKTNDKGEATLSFYNADNNATVVIKADGISDKGTAVAAKTVYKVQ